ncbi:MAG: aminotransferase class V-fold PLP-dependent enzyme [Oscillospiraceae bacterium]|nr:aminotransferase class V-fold PLP-dependent enzyme [Oscillospiraceae bacterium]
MRQVAHTPVYFDNAATSFPKPEAVYAAVGRAMREAGGNPGRGGHPLSALAGETVYHMREAAAELFAAEPEHIVMTLNCTHALNLAIYGLLRQGDHVIISNLEHNSVARPAAALADAGVIRLSVARVYPDDDKTVAELRRLLTPRTRAVICTLVSNVTGQILPYRQLAALCRANGTVMIADGAQGCGILPVTLRDGMHLLCTAGHKGLYGPTGTGLLISDGTVPLKPLMQGGTGSRSASLEQPDFLPDALEPGTVNVSGAAGLEAGMRHVMQTGTERIFAAESAVCERLLAGLRRLPDAVIFRTEGARYAPVISFTLGRESPDETAARLAEQGFCVRAGLHCAPLAHRALGTAHGTVRISPSAFNTAQEADAFLKALRRDVPAK